MKVAVSITKVFEVEDMTIDELMHKMEDPNLDDEVEIDWYDLDAESEFWSYAKVD